jgi:hypothetical protein
MSRKTLSPYFNQHPQPALILANNPILASFHCATPPLIMIQGSQHTAKLLR